MQCSSDLRDRTSVAALSANAFDVGTQTTHHADRCRFKDARCFGCGKIGHIGRVCRSRKGRAVQTVRDQVVEEEGLSSEATEYHLHALSTQQSSDPITVEVSINGEQVHMEVDTGAAVSLVSEVVCI